MHNPRLLPPDGNRIYTKRNNMLQNELTFIQLGYIQKKLKIHEPNSKISARMKKYGT